MEGCNVTAPYGFQVRVVCNDRSHEGRTVIVSTFTYVDLVAEWPDVFGPDAPTGPAEWMHDLAAARALEDDVATGRLAERAADEYEIRGDDGPSAFGRRRYRLPCRLCGLNVEVRHERLAPVLDGLADHGVRSVELAHLAGILSA